MSSAYVTSYATEHLPKLDAHSVRRIFPQDRFINNPHSKHILSDDIYKVNLGKDGQLEMKTFLVKTNSIPLIFQKYWPNCPIRIGFVEEMEFQYGENFRQKYGNDRILQLSRNLEFRDLMTTHERAVINLHSASGDNQGGNVSVKKDFLCRSFQRGLTGIMLTKFGFWRYSSNHLKANEGLALKCLEFKKEIELQRIESAERQEATLAGRGSKDTIAIPVSRTGSEKLVE